MIKILLNAFFWLLVCPMASAIAPPPPETAYSGLYIGTNNVLLLGIDGRGHGLYRKVGNDSWRAVFSEPEASMPAAAGNAGLFLNSGSSLYYSPDQGATWTVVGPRHDIQAHDAAGTLYACALGNIERSVNKGRTWESLPPWPMLQEVKIDYCNILTAAGGIYAIVSAHYGKDGRQFFIHYSKDRGKTWASSHQFSEKTPPVGALIGREDTFVDKNGTLFVNHIQEEGDKAQPDFLTSIYQSTDKGAHWKKMQFKGVDKKIDFKMVAVSGNTIYFVCSAHNFKVHMKENQELCKSEDGQRAERIGSYPEADHITVSPDGQIFAWDRYTYNGVRVWDIKTKSWKRLAEDGLPLGH